jgi:starch phosphorylase
LKADKNLVIVPRTFIFGAKAASGYFRAKGIIKLIQEIKRMINNDPEMDGKIKVVFVENYRVSYAERLFPAADLSEQISTAGKEASGTGNMKFMLNGAPTIGTFDGANVEIVEEAGEDNNFIFGLRVEDINGIKDAYQPKVEYNNTKGLKKVLDALTDGTLDDGGTGMFKELFDSLLTGADWHKPDVYYLLKDFDSYREAQKKVDEAYLDRMGWARKCWMNIANAGKFSSDRTIHQYAEEIWKIEQTK